MQKKRRVRPLNWTFGYWFVFSVALLIPSVVYFCLFPQEFYIGYFWKGALGGMFTTVGCVFAGLAIASGAALGPMQSILSSQMLVLTLIEALVPNGIIPNNMQIVGLIIGFVSALLITIPKQIGIFFDKICPCLKKSQQQASLI